MYNNTPPLSIRNFLGFSMEKRSWSKRARLFVVNPSFLEESGIEAFTLRKHFLFSIHLVNYATDRHWAPNMVSIAMLTGGME